MRDALRQLKTWPEAVDFHQKLTIDVWRDEILPLYDFWEDLDLPVRRCLLRLLLLQGDRQSILRFQRYFVMKENRDTALTVLNEAGLMSVNAIVEIRRRIPDSSLKAWSQDIERLYQIIENAGFFKGLEILSGHRDEKVILYALRQFYQFPSGEILRYIAPLAEHRNPLVRTNMVEILHSIGTDEALHLMLNFLGDADKETRERAKERTRQQFARCYPVIIRRLEDAADPCLYPLINLVGEVGDTTVLDKLTDYVLNYKKPLNNRAFVAFEAIASRQIGKETFSPAGGHHRIAIFLKGMLLAAPDGAVEAIAAFIQRLGKEAILMLLWEYVSAGTIERRNLQHVFNKMTELDNDILFQHVSTIDEPVLLALCELLQSRLGVSDFQRLLSRMIDTLPPEVLDRSLKGLLDLYGDHHIMREKCYSILRKKTPDRWRIILQHLGRSGDLKLLETLSLEINDENLESRLNIIDTLGNFHCAEAIEILEKITDDPRPKVRTALVEVLSRIDSLEATVLLFKLFTLESNTGNKELVQIIARKGRDRFFRYIEKISEKQRNEFGMQLAHHDDDFVTDVSRNLFSLNFDERKRALELLILISDRRKDEVMEQLKSLINDPDERLRALLSRTIAMIGGAEVSDLVLELLDDPDPRVRANAIEILPAIHDEKLMAAIYPFLRDENNRVRANAVMTLYRLGDSRVLVAISEMLKSTDKWMRASAAFAMGEIDDQRTQPILISFLDDPDLDVRRNVIKALGKVGDRSATKYLLRFLSAPDKSIAEEASRAVNAIKERSKL